MPQRLGSRGQLETQHGGPAERVEQIHVEMLKFLLDVILQESEGAARAGGQKQMLWHGEHRPRLTPM